MSIAAQVQPTNLRELPATAVRAVRAVRAGIMRDDTDILVCGSLHL